LTIIIIAFNDSNVFVGLKHVAGEYVAFHKSI
jgi:hypothetical protein